MSIGGREAALKALRAYRKSGAWSDAYLDGLIRKEGMDKREAGLSYRLCMGVLQNRALCDYYAASYVSKGIESLEAEVAEIIRLGVYQILFTDKIPVRAAVSESVELAKRYANRGAAGVVNAVLRRVAENKERIVEPTELGIRYSHPKELVDYLIGRVGAEQTEGLLRYNNETLPVSVRVNRLKVTEKEVEAELEGSGIEYRKDEINAGYYKIKGGFGGIEKLRIFREGGIAVLSTASAMAVEVCAPEPGERILDACSAPGGKAFYMAEKMRNEGEIQAWDINGKKLRHVREGAERLGIGIIKTQCRDAREREREYEGQFDRILCDVPCSGYGMIGRKPEIRYKTLESVSKLPEIQSGILRNLADYLKPGGILVYSTCTLIKAENEDIVEGFIKERDDYEMVGINLAGMEERVGNVTLWPQIHGTDGFFISKMRKRTE